MAKVTKKHINKSVTKSVPEFKPLDTDIDTVETKTEKTPKANMQFFLKLIAVIIVGSLLYFLAQKYRGVFLAGMVGTKPVTRWELNQKMSERYGKSTLDEIATEYLLQSEVKKNGIVVDSAELDAEFAKIKADYGGDDAFKGALEQYGMTETQAKESIKKSISVKKLAEKLFAIQITDEEIKKYFDDNSKDVYKDKKLDDVKTEISESLKQQKIGEQFQTWFAKLKEESKVQSFL